MTKILIVEDAEPVGALIEDLLKQRGYQIMTAADGKKGLEAARKELPDLVICDVMVPELDGIELCRKLKSDPAASRVKVIMLSSLDRRKNIEAAFAAGAAEYVVKPFDNGKFVRLVEEVLKGK